MRYLGICLVVMMMVGCNEQAELDLRTSGRPIVNGEIDSNPAHMATVALTNGPGSDFFCSGTLITSTVVLTAGHCLWGGSSGIQVYFGPDVTAPGDYVAVIEDETHPDFDMQSVEADIALLRLASPAPAGVTPIPHLPSALGLTTADEGVTTVDFSGFGVDENRNSGVKLHVEDVIDVVCDNINGCDWVNNRAFGYDQQPGGPCSGDSGGPAYVMRSTVEYVAGITSYGDQQCERYGVSTTVDRFEPFINSFITPEICDNQVDDDTDGQTDCEDRECALDPSCPDACEAAQTIACGGQASGTTEGGAWAFVQYSCMGQGDGETGPEVAFLVDAPEGTRVTADLFPGAGGDLDFFLVQASGGGCDPANDCLDSSTDYNRPEQIVFNVPTGGAYLVVDTWDTPTTFDIQIQCGAVVEVCDNNVDDDQDGDTDCDDSDCAINPACQPDACVVATQINCGAQVTGDTRNGVMQFETYSCLRQSTEDGPEVAYELNIPAGTRVTAEMSHGGGADLDLFLLPASGDSCDTDACIDSSTDYGGTERIEFDMPAGGAYLVVDTYQNATGFSVSVACATPAEVCDNQVDDDLDGDTDCDDGDCVLDPACQGPAEDCDNQVDDDQDGDTDCDDADCADDPACLVEICDNQVDDDLDGDTDCDDADCDADPACVPPEDCENGEDDDLDGDTDCDDGDCEEHVACQTPVEDCTNQKDDDGDGKADCGDEDCANDPACQGLEENCSNGKDDDGDTIVDCFDDDCEGATVCEGTSYGCDCGTSGEGVGGGLILLGAFVALFRARARARARARITGK